MTYSLWHTLSAFLPNIKLEQFQVTVLKPSRDFSKTKNNCNVNHSSRTNVFLKFSQNGSLVLRSTVHGSYVFVEYRTGVIADHSFKKL